MASIQNQIGKKGEEIAREYLITKGYDIVDSNWRYKKSEIDLIARKEDLLIFIEVKSRSSIRFGKPEEFIDDHKIKNLCRAASRYMMERGYEWEFRFDVVAILFKDPINYDLRHIEDAFFPGVL